MAATEKYSDELRERATRLALEPTRPDGPVARDLGVPKEALGASVGQAEADAAGGTPAVLSSSEREELKRLRGEVRERRQANEIVKAPASISPQWCAQSAEVDDVRLCSVCISSSSPAGKVRLR